MFTGSTLSRLIKPSSHGSTPVSASVELRNDDTVTSTDIVPAHRHQTGLIHILSITSQLVTDSGRVLIWSDLNRSQRASLAATCNSVAAIAELSSLRWPRSQLSICGGWAVHVDGLQPASISHLEMDMDTAKYKNGVWNSVNNLRPFYAPELHVKLTCKVGQMIGALESLNYVNKALASVTFTTADALNAVSVLSRDTGKERNWARAETEFLVLPVSSLGTLTATSAPPHTCRHYGEAFPTIVLLEDLSQSSQTHEMCNPSTRRSLVQSLLPNRALEERARAIARVACDVGRATLIVSALPASDASSRSSRASSSLSGAESDQLEKCTRKLIKRDTKCKSRCATRTTLIFVPPQKRAELLQRIGLGSKTEDVCEGLVQ